MSLPVGNGYYIWLMDRCTGGNPGAIAAKAKAAGLGWVALKVANGVATFGDFNKNKELVQALHEQGIQAWAWHYVYGYNPTKEADIAAQQSNLLGVDGYVINAEVEYKLDGRAAAARTYMDRLRNQYKGTIGLTSFRFPSYHMEFPWKEFLPRIDFNSPQVYWIGATNAAQQLERSVAEFRKMAPNQPLVPLGAAFSDMGWRPTTDQILEFRYKVKELNLPGYGWWEWYHAETKNPHFWAASVGPLDGTTPEPEPDPEPEPEDKLVYVMTQYKNLRLRSAPSITATILGYLEANVPHILEARQGDWGKVKTTYPESWVHMGYVEFVEQVIFTPAIRVTTTYSDLRIRKGPSLSAEIVGYMVPNVVYNIISQSGKWGKIAGEESRWVHLDYVTML